MFLKDKIRMFAYGCFERLKVVLQPPSLLCGKEGGLFYVTIQPRAGAGLNCNRHHPHF